LAFRRRLKITVLKKLSSSDIFKGKLPVNPKYGPVCDRLEEGREFIVEDSGAMPEGFCPWAWDSMTREITHLQMNGDFPWYEETGVAISCCTDGIRPVIFKLQRLD